jgi:hypothetical protein
MSARQEKITFADMRAAGVRGILVYSDYRCSHSLALMADQWPDCQARRRRAAGLQLEQEAGQDDEVSVGRYGCRFRLVGSNSPGGEPMIVFVELRDAPFTFDCARKNRSRYLYCAR